MNNKYIKNVVNSVGSLACGNVGNAWFHHGMEPWFITGFTDGEGCFSINVTNSDRYKTGFKVELFFSIGLHYKDKVLLEQIKNFFGVGSITKYGAEAIQYRVSSVKDLTKIMDHFEKYPLLTQKRADYLLFKEVFNIIKRKEHLIVEGLQSIINIRASMNWGLSDKLKAAFPNTAPIQRPVLVNQVIRNLNWISGFVSAEGSFLVNIFNSSAKLGITPRLIFNISQHPRDEQLFKNFIELFDCGRVYLRKEGVYFLVGKFSDIENKIIPFFIKYPIQGAKSQDFVDFSKIVDIMKNKDHLNKEGLDLIRKIKTGMNQRRKLP